MLVQTAVGAIVVSTVTTASQLEIFPLESVTVSVTMFSPRLSHVKVSRSMLVVISPQLSELPPSIASGVIVAIPFSSRITVNGSHTALGATSSVKVTVKLQVT